MYAWLGRGLYQLLLPIIRIALNGSDRVKVVIVHDAKVLLIKNWLGTQRWTLPGGGMKSRETAQAAATRELHEELGISLSDKRLKLGPILQRGGVDGLRWRNHIVYYHATDTIRINRNRLELLEFAWHNISKLPENHEPVVDHALSTS